jgi:hypothetical protein
LNGLMNFVSDGLKIEVTFDGCLMTLSQISAMLWPTTLVIITIDIEYMSIKKEPH